MMVQQIQGLYHFLGIEAQAGIYDLAGLLSVLLLLAAALGMALSGRSERTTPQKEREEGEVWEHRLRRGMNKSRSHFWRPLKALFNGKGLSQEALDGVEEILYGADLGPGTTQLVIEELTRQVGNQGYGPEDLKHLIKGILREKIAPIQGKLQEGDFLQFDPSSSQKRPQTIMVVGVNGAGKTTTIGKLATKLQRQGAKVVVGACDTFRAAAVDQLQVWCDRANCEMVRAKDGADPSGVGYETLQRAMALQADYCLLDTAGRLHTKDNLMEELKKSKRVLAKLDPTAPHQVILILDAITGQNALRQAEEFNRALELSGLILTKCDGSSKAGSVVSIVEKLQVPIFQIGVGEGVEDLNKFYLDEYLDAMLS